MPLTQMDYGQLELMALRLDVTHHAFDALLGELRRQMNNSCDQGAISLRQWRSLQDRIAALQVSRPKTAETGTSSGATSFGKET